MLLIEHGGYQYYFIIMEFYGFDFIRHKNLYHYIDEKSIFKFEMSTSFYVGASMTPLILLKHL